MRVVIELLDTLHEGKHYEANGMKVSSFAVAFLCSLTRTTVASRMVFEVDRIPTMDPDLVPDRLPEPERGHGGS